MQDSALLPPPAEEEAPRAGLSLALQLPPGTAAGPDRVSRRWSLDGAGSEHGASSEHDWELLSHGHHSYCGSSPRSVSASEAYDSEGEAEGEAGRRRLAGAADQLGGTPLGGDAEHAEQEPGLQPFGSLVMPAHEHLAAAAAAADEGSDEARGAAAADRPASPPPSAPFSAASTPRSSYGHASSRTSRHDLYSLSQVRRGRLGLGNAAAAGCTAAALPGVNACSGGQRGSPAYLPPLRHLQLWREHRPCVRCLNSIAA